MAAKPLFHRLGSTGMLALYRMTKGRKGSKEIFILFVDLELNAFSMGIYIWERGREKLQCTVLLTKEERN